MMHCRWGIWAAGCRSDPLTIDATYQQIESGYTSNDEHSFTCSSAATQTLNYDSDGSQSLEILSIITGSTGESIEKGPAAPVVTETI